MPLEFRVFLEICVSGFALCGGVTLLILAQSWAELTGSAAGPDEVEARERLLAKVAWVCLAIGLVSGIAGVARFQDLRWQLDDAGYRRGLTEGETYGRARGRLEYALDHAPAAELCKDLSEQP